MTIEAMKQALDALQGSGYYDTTQQREAITALRQAIDAADKDWILLEATQESLREHMIEIHRMRDALEQAEKQEHDLNDVRCECCGYMTYHREHMGCIKAAYQQAEKQEPVAWSVLNKRTGKHWYTHESRYTAQYYANEYSYRESDNTPSMVVTPLYTAPPKREWQGLTDVEIFDVIRSFCKDDEAAEMLINISMDEYRAIEAKLKEKNT